MQVPRRRPLGLALRVAATLAILAGLFVWLPREVLAEALARTPPLLWAASVAAFAAGHLLAALKWRALVSAAGAPVAARDALRAHAAGLFSNLFLPSLAGGDVVRAGLLARRGGALAPVAAAGLADRLCDTAALVSLAALGAALAPAHAGGLDARILAASAALTAVALVGFGLAARRARSRDRLLGSARLARVRRGLAALAARPPLAAAVFAASLAIQTGFVGLNALLGRALGIEIPFAAWLLAWPLAKLAALFPTLGGIGVRELALAALLSPFGVAPALAVAQGLVWESVLIATCLVAGALAWRGGTRPAAALREEPG